MSDESVEEIFLPFPHSHEKSDWKLSAVVLVTLREKRKEERATASNVNLFQRLKAHCGMKMLFWKTVYIMLHDLMNVVEWICMEFP